MFSKISRYRKLTDDVAVDAKGRRLASKSLRLLPEVSGDFLHTVEEIDRLDHLSYKYYQQPRTWWRICDANPMFLSPHALLGKEPLMTAQFPLSWDGPTPPWSVLLKDLMQMFGVETAHLGTPEQPAPEVEVLDGDPTYVIDDAALVGDVQALANYLRTGEPPEARLTAEALTTMLKTALEGQGIAFGGEVRLWSVESSQWRLIDEGTGQVYTFRLVEAEALLNVYASEFRYTWAVTVTFNTVNTSAEALAAVMEGEGFDVGVPVSIGRVGKQVVIPLRTTL